MRKSLLALFLLTGFTALPAQALDSKFGVKAGMLSVEGDSGAATQAGVIWTADILGMLGVEFDASTTLSDGDSGFGDYSATQLGGYGVLMTPGPIYFKAKAGYVYSDFEFDTPLGAVDDSDNDVAYGVGIGFEALAALEIEYTRTKWLDQDVDLISASFRF